MMNQEQQQFYDRVVELSGKSKCFVVVLDAPGGTGKTFTIKQIINRLKNVCVIAPTHKACALFQKEKVRAQTIHRFLNSELDIDPETGETIFVFDPKKQKGTVVIVDECSMVNSEMFDSLHKACDMVIFVGDRCQLPPVNEPFSRVFTELTDIYSLKTNMRVGLNPDSLSAMYLQKFRHGVDNPSCKLRVDKKPIEFMLPYFQGEVDAVALAWTNARVAELNRVIRTYLYGSNLEKYYVGERLIFSGFRKTDIQIHVEDLEDPETPGKMKLSYLKYYTSDTIQVCNLEVEKTFIPFQVEHCKHKDHSKKVQKCEVCEIRGHKTLGHEVTFYQITDQNLVTWYRVKDGAEGLKEVIADFKASCKKLKQKALWQQYYSFIATYDADLNYKYASTVHKMQGSQASVVFVDINNIRLCRKQEERVRMEYTAVSRYSQMVFFI